LSKNRVKKEENRKEEFGEVDRLGYEGKRRGSPLRETPLIEATQEKGRWTSLLEKKEKGKKLGRQLCEESDRSRVPRGEKEVLEKAGSRGGDSSEGGGGNGPRTRFRKVLFHGGDRKPGKKGKERRWTQI